MGGKSGAEKAAERSARAADKARADLEKQTKTLKERSEREQKKAQRLLIRSSRSAGGGFFETDVAPAADKTTLGGSGDLG